MPERCWAWTKNKAPRTKTPKSPPAEHFPPGHPDDSPDHEVGQRDEKPNLPPLCLREVARPVVHRRARRPVVRQRRRKIREICERQGRDDRRRSGCGQYQKEWEI